MSRGGETVGLPAEEQQHKSTMTRNTNPYREKGLSVFLAVLMVLSMVAVGAIFVAPAAADHAPDETYDWDGWTTDTDFWAGQEILVQNLNQSFVDPDAVRVYEGTRQTGVDGEAERVTTLRVEDGAVTLDSDLTSDFDGPYHLEIEHAGGTDRSDTMWFGDHGVSVSFDQETVGFQAGESGAATLTLDDLGDRNESVDLIVTGERDGEALNTTQLGAIFGASVNHPGDSVLVENLSVGGMTQADFDDSEYGEYNFTFTVHDDSASQTVSLSVVEADPFRVVGFADEEYSTAQGDWWRNIGIEVENPESFQPPTFHQNGSVADWGDRFDVVIEAEGFEHHFAVYDIHAPSVEDAGGVYEISWNTYFLGNSTFGYVTWSGQAGGNAAPPAIAPPSFDDPLPTWGVGTTELDDGFRLEPDTYFAQVFDEPQTWGEDPTTQRIDSANLILEENGAEELETHIAPQMDLGQATRGDVLDASSEFDEVAEGDVVVIRQEVDGLWGYHNGGLDLHTRATRPGMTGSEELSFEVTQNNPDRYQNPRTLDESDAGVYVYDEVLTNEIVIAIDTDEADLELPDGAEEQTWTANFSITSDVMDEQTSTEFTVVEREFELVEIEEPVSVAPTEESQIRGTTTIAPGYEVEGTLDFSPEFFDVFTTEVTVEDGERVFVFEQDFSENEDHVGEEFDLEATSSAGDVSSKTGVWNMTPESETLSTEQRLEQQLEEAEQQLADAEDENVELQIEVGDLEEERDSLQAQVDGLRTQVEDLESQNEELTNENEQLQSDLESAESERDEAQAENDEWSEAAGEDVSSPQELEEFMADAQPGFGPIAALIALLAGGALMARRRL